MLTKTFSTRQELVSNHKQKVLLTLLLAILTYSTCLGGGYSAARSIALDNAGNAYTGNETSSNLSGALPLQLTTCAYAINFDTTQNFATKLYKLNPSTGATISSINITPNIGASIGIELGSNGSLYTVTTWGAQSNPNSLFKIDPATGASQLIGPLGNSVGNVLEGDLAFDASGTLYGISDNKLFTVNLTTGQATLMGTVPGLSRDISELAFDTNSGTLYAIDNRLLAGTQTFLLRLNPSNATIISSQIITPNLGSWGGMDFDPVSGLLYVADGGSGATNKLYTLNPQTGGMTLVGPTSVTPSLAGLALCASSPPQCVLPPNTTMVAWYPFDESGGTMAANLATSNIGSKFGNPAVIPGKVGNALSFDGVNDFVESPSSIVTNIGPAGLPTTCSGAYSTCQGNFSIDAWVRIPVNSSNLIMPVVEKKNTLRGYGFWIFNGRLLLQLADAGVGTGATTYNSNPIPSLYNNQWHLVAVTISRRASPAGIRWYFDGNLISTSNPTNAPNRFGSLVNNVPLLIGASSPDPNAGRFWFKGDMDEVEIFNRVLTPQEISDIFNAGSAGKCKRLSL